MNVFKCVLSHVLVVCLIAGPFDMAGRKFIKALAKVLESLFAEKVRVLVPEINDSRDIIPVLNRIDSGCDPCYRQLSLQPENFYDICRSSCIGPVAVLHKRTAEFHELRNPGRLF